MTSCNRVEWRHLILSHLNVPILKRRLAMENAGTRFINVSNIGEIVNMRKENFHQV